MSMKLANLVRSGLMRQLMLTTKETNSMMSPVAKHRCMTTTPKKKLADFKIKERVLFTLQLNDKVDNDKLNIDSHFLEQLGLTPKDHAEVIDAMEEEFDVEIPDNDAKKLVRPIDIVKYVADVIQIRSQFDESHEDWRKRLSMAYF